jgi:hypothetical protein
VCVVPKLFFIEAVEKEDDETGKPPDPEEEDPG